MLKTKFTELTGCRVPIQMAAIGSLARPPLAAAVSNAGGLGMLQLSGFTPEQATRSLDEVRKRTRNVFGANFIVTEAWYPDLEELREVVETASKHAKVVEFFYRQPDSSLVELVHKNGALASWQVGSNDEAVAATKAGCDLIVAQGIEAGGHIRGKIGLLSLLGQVLDSVTVPVLAAGASGVRVGTRFIVAEEAEAHPQYQKALIGAEPEDTVVTEVFSENWPNAPHRVLRSSVEAAQAFKGEIVGQRRLASSGEMAPAKRFESITMTRDTTGTLEAMPHWAGESVASVEKVQPAAAIIDELVSEAERLLHNWK